MKIELTRSRTAAAVAILCVLALVVLAALLLRKPGDEEGGAPKEAALTSSSGPVAFDGTNYFVVWADDRGPGTGIYGARVSATATVLDETPIPMSTARGTQSSPEVAFDGTNFLVVWTDDRSATSTDDYDSFDVYGTRVSQEGNVLDPAGIPISTAEEDQSIGDVSFDGSNFLVVWDSQDPDGYNIHGARISPAGAVLDPKGFPISRARDEQTDPHVAFGGSHYLVTWSDARVGEGYDIFAARVSPTGKALDPGGIRISRGGSAWEAPAVAFGDENYLVAWTHWETGYYQEVRGARVSPEGTVLDPEGLVIAQSESEDSGQVVATDGSNFLVVWSQTHEEEVEPGSFTETGDVYGARVSTDGVVLDAVGRAISAGPADQGAHGLGFDGENYFLTVNAERSPFSERYDLRGVRLTRKGEPVKGPPITIAEADFP
jgi:hypothetical protein